MRKVTCTNSDGASIIFENDFSPWLLTDVDGIYLMDINVYTSDNTMTDGATYQGSTVKKRNIVLTALDKGTDHKKDRQLIYTVFKPKSKGTFTYEEEGDVRTIDYYVEKAEIESLGKHRYATISLICPDPFFSDSEDTQVMVAGWEGLFTFPHKFKMEPIGKRKEEKFGIITNETAADNIGMDIVITAMGTVTNPSVMRVESQQTMKIGTAAKPLTLKVGDSLRITTGTNDKHVYLDTGSGENEINSYLDESSEFIQLMRGTNTIGYNADSGAQYMEVMVKFRYKHLGV